MSADPGIEVIPDWTDKPTWKEKLHLWASLIEKGCTLKRGRGGMFCGWGGHSCYYNACPRRLFEEDAAEGIPQPSTDLIKQFKENEEKMNQMETTLGNAMKEIETLKKELNKAS